MQRMKERGVTFRLNTRVTDARSGSVTWSSGEEIATETFVWTAGARPSPILKELPVNLRLRLALRYPHRNGINADKKWLLITESLNGNKTTHSNTNPSCEQR
jgi:NADH dehydrogenase FAD-containing subunit